MRKSAANKDLNALEHYHTKRDFEKTTEPRGEVAAQESFTYVIQKHEASHLHYDFRLELDGTLKSWAVPKGPPYDPHDKRLAMQVEDHPVEYAAFEGIIPQGEYGGGTVMLWDHGTWEPVGDPRAGLLAGKLVFRLHGVRLEGEWTLVRTHGRKTAAHAGHSDDNGRQWLLMKHRDEFVREGDAGAFVAANTTSVSTGRTMAQIAANAKPAKPKATKAKSKEAKRIKTSPKVKIEESSQSMPLAPLPGFIEPQLATLTDAMPTGSAWVHEVKFDGYRMLTYIENGDVRMISRNKKDWTASFGQLADTVAQLPVKSAIIDGEVVCLDENKRSDFSRLKTALADNTTAQLQYFAFDLLFVNGVDVRDQPLTERKQLLAAILAKLPAKAKSTIQFSAGFADDAGTFFKNVCDMQLEGVVSKRADTPYLSGRGRAWLKTKCLKRQEFVIVGFTPPANGTNGIGALLLGYYEKKILHYAGRVGTGWNAASALKLRTRLNAIRQTKNLLDDIDAAARRHAQWVKPELVCEVQFAEWTPDGHLRHPAFKGLREDKTATEIGRERAVPLAEAQTEVQTEIQITPAPPIMKPSRAKTNKSRESAPLSDGSSGGNAIVSGIKISHPDRIIFPETQITKQMLAEYYLAIADRLLPHIVKRPISILRCPGGAGEKCFFQRHLGLGSSPHLHELAVPIKGASEEYLMIDDVEGLLALVQWGVIEIHPWQCTAAKLDKPDRLIFDLDPAPDVEWSAVISGALEIKDRMAELGLTSFVKTTGGKGLHIVVPMAPVYGWDVIKSFARLIAQSMEADSPKQYLSRMTKAARTGRIYVDYLRNENTATAVAPFSARARSGAPVATPLTWKELVPKLNPMQFTVDALIGRAQKLKVDPWVGFFDIKQRLQKKHLKALDLVD